MVCCCVSSCGTNAICLQANSPSSCTDWRRKRNMCVHAQRQPSRRTHTHTRNISRSIEFQYKLHTHIQRRFYLILIRTKRANPLRSHIAFTSQRITIAPRHTPSPPPRVYAMYAMRTFVVPDGGWGGGGVGAYRTDCGNAFMSDIRTRA